MSIQNEIDRIKENVADAYSAVEERGGSIPEDATVANLADSIATIPQGAVGSINWEDINGRPDLSNVSKLDVVQAAIPTYLWDENSEATIPVEKISADASSQLITPAPTSDSYNAYYECDIKLIAQAEGILTFKAEIVPEEDVSVYIYIQSVSELSEEYVGEFVWWSPQMTSDTTPEPFKCNADSWVGGDSSPSGIWVAFDNNASSYWHSNTASQHWISFDFGKRCVCNGIRLKPRPDTYSSGLCKTGTIQGSNNNNEWYDILAFENLPNPSDYDFREHVFDKIVNYRYYRIANMTSNYGAYVCIAEIQFKVLEGSV